MLSCEVDVEQSGFPGVTNMAIPEDQGYLYGCFPNDCCDGTIRNSTFSSSDTTDQKIGLGFHSNYDGYCTRLIQETVA